MKLRVLGVLSVLVVLLVLIVSNVILSSAGRELTSALQINRAASLNRIAQVSRDVLDIAGMPLFAAIFATFGVLGASYKILGLLAWYDLGPGRRRR